MPAILAASRADPLSASSLSPTILKKPAVFDIVERAPGVFDFVGSACGRITMYVSADGRASFVRQNTKAAQTLCLKSSAGVLLRLEAGDEIRVESAYGLHKWDLRFSGPGRVDIAKVHILPASLQGTDRLPVRVTPDISRFLNRHRGETSVTVNGSDRDLIKVSWFYWRRQRERLLARDYYQWAMDGADLALRYRDFLNWGGAPLTNFIIDVSESPHGTMRSLSLHDELLDILSEPMLRRYFLEHNASEPANLPINKEGLYELYLALAGDFAYRKVGSDPGFDETGV